MNCKPGDLAIVVRSICGNEGKVVRCIRLDDRVSSEPSRMPDGTIVAPEPAWVIDRPLSDWEGEMSSYCWDSQLRPIRNPGDDAQDETLAWKPVPLPAIQPELLERA